MTRNSFDIVEATIKSVEPVFAQVLGAGYEAQFTAEAGFAIQILTGSDYAMKVATGNRQSVIDAVTNVAAIGVTLNPVKRQAYLVPRDGRICLDISYQGLMDIAIAGGAIRWAQCIVVHQEDEFTLMDVDKPPHHKRDPFSKGRGDIVGVYAVVKTADSDFLTHAMSIADVIKIRDRSVAWRAWVEKKRSCPWVTDATEMIRKTCIKQASKYWPRGSASALDKAIDYLNGQLGEGLAEIEAIKDRMAAANDPVTSDLYKVGKVHALNGTEAYSKWFTGLTKQQRQSIAEDHKGLKAIAEDADAKRPAMQEAS